jgi:hypothetical protein
MRRKVSGSTKPDDTPVQSVAKRVRPPSIAARTRTRAPSGTNHGTINGPSEEQIRIRAYHLYLQRAGRSNDPLDDWLRAEREVIAGLIGSDPQSDRRRNTTTAMKRRAS